MLFGPDNFLSGLKELFTGGGRHSDGTPFLDSGFLKDSPDLLGSSVLATSVTFVTSSDGFPVLSAAAGITAVANVLFRVPRDYDENTDKLFVRFVAESAGSTNSPKITVSAKAETVGSASASLTAVSAQTAATSTTAQSFEVEFRGQGLKRDQLVEITLVSEAHATDALRLRALGLTYHSTLVSYNRSSTAGAAGGTGPDDLR